MNVIDIGASLALTGDAAAAATRAETAAGLAEGYMGRAETAAEQAATRNFGISVSGTKLVISERSDD